MVLSSRLSERWRDKTTYGLYADGMQELDYVVGDPLQRGRGLGPTVLRAFVADVVFVLLTVALFAALAVLVRAVFLESC